MSKLSFDEIQTIQENATRKLIAYINENIKNDKSLETIEFYYPDFDERKARLAFNVWVSIDYINNSGKTFIEQMLEERSNELSNAEKIILIERNKSFISLYEIKNIKGNKVHVRDLLTSKDHVLWEPVTSSILNKGDLIFGRIGNIIDFKGFIGNISFLPSSVKDRFIENVLVDYNRTKFRYPDLTIERYLKLKSINVYRIYTECIYDVINMGLDEEDDITTALYEELDDFEYYLQGQMSRSEIKKHITNLINIFENYVIEYGNSLHDIAKLDLEHMIKEAIKDGFILSQQELSSYISTLKKYFKYLKSIRPEYKDAYKNILEISKNRFLYLNHKIKLIPNFDINRTISTNISNGIIEFDFDFIMDYERFLLFLMSNPIPLTKKRKYIKRKNLEELNNIMENRTNVQKKRPNQEDFPMLEFFYHFSLEIGLANIKGEYLNATNKAHYYLRLSDEEKYSLFIQYILSNNFFYINKKKLDVHIAIKTRDNLIEMLSQLKEGIFYEYSKFNLMNVGPFKYIQSYIKHLKLVGLIEYSYYPTFSLGITPLGRAIFNILSSKDHLKSNHGKVIYLNCYGKY